MLSLSVGKKGVFPILFDDYLQAITGIRSGERFKSAALYFWRSSRDLSIAAAETGMGVPGPNTCFTPAAYSSS